MTYLGKVLEMVCAQILRMPPYRQFSRESADPGSHLAGENHNSSGGESLPIEKTDFEVTTSEFAGLSAYRAKDPPYFASIRRDYVDSLPQNPDASILEIGCGYGGTGEFALATGKCGDYFGVELCDEAAEQAKRKLTGLLVGNVEELEFEWAPESFDALILSEVLEHLVDPWAVLRKIRPLMKPGALVLASSPNVSHYSIIWMLLRGQWTLTSSGITDRTHLRWFTPSTYRELFEDAGYVVDSVSNLPVFGWKANTLNAVTLGMLKHVLSYQIDLRAHVGK
jgi:2-polyprenyl-3-methyl-5-hydroxy-6-metoxy-1,4-benzoquinol methylase